MARRSLILPSLFVAMCILIIIMSQNLQSIDARNLKLEKKHDHHVQTTTQIIISSSKIGFITAEDEVAIISAATPPAPAAVNVQQPPPTTHTSPPGRVDNFRPTAPGRSPGIGNSIQN